MPQRGKLETIPDRGLAHNLLKTQSIDTDGPKSASLANGLRFYSVQLAPEVFVLEPTLMVIGLNHRTAPLAMRERFWIGENRRYEVLRQLKSAEGIEEVVVLSTCCRTEFLVWASEPTLAANSLLHFLGVEHGLKLSEWEHFYRLLDECALTHVFRVTSGLDSLVLGEPQIVSQVKAAWEQARTVSAAGRFLNAVLEKALNVSKQVREGTAIEKLSVSIPTAALDLARHIFGSLDGRRVLLLGTGKMSELSARQMMDSGAASVVVIDQSSTRAHELAEKLGGTAATLADRWKCMLGADIVISATGCPHVVLTREEAERIAIERNRVALVIMDIGMPRDVDPDVRRVDGILLYDLDGLERAVQNNAVGACGGGRWRRKRLWLQRRKPFAANCRRRAWCRPLWRCAIASTKFAGRNWSPLSKSAGRLRGSRINRFTQSQHKSYRRLPAPWLANSRNFQRRRNRSR